MNYRKENVTKNEGIKMKVEGEWVKAQGTTLGADNGLGVAAIMGVLASKDIKHPAIEALFTIDEETGMTGAKGLQAGYLNQFIVKSDGINMERNHQFQAAVTYNFDFTKKRE